MKDKNFMAMANSLGKLALTRGDYPAGCVIVKEGEVIAKSSSRGITKKDVTAHAEILALSKACKKLKSRVLCGCALYSNIEPCLMCGKAIVYSGINKVFYGINHGEYGKMKTFDILKNNGIGKGVKAIQSFASEEPSKLLRQFLRHKR